MKKEPVLIATFARFALLLAGFFGITLSDADTEQLIALIVGAWAAVEALIVFVIRKNVWSKASVEKVTGAPVQLAEESLKLR